MYNYNFQTKQISFIFDNIKEIIFHNNLLSVFPSSKGITVKMRENFFNNLVVPTIVVDRKSMPSITRLVMYNNTDPHAGVQGSFYIKNIKVYYRILDSGTTLLLTQ